MSIGSTTRLGLTTWSSGDDPFGRAQFQNDNLSLEDLVAAFRSGSTAERSSATGEKYSESFWYDTTESVLYYYDGTSWKPIDSKAQSSDAATLVPGTATTPQGTSTRLARADHSHSVPVASATTVSGTNSAGSASTFARSDHDHAIATGAIGATQLASDSVTTAKILDLNVTTGKINDLAVTTGKIAAGAVTPAKLNSSVATTNGGVLYDSSTGLSVSVDDSTVTKSASGQVKVKDAGITATQIASSIAGDGLSGGAGTALAVNTDGSSIEISADSLRVKALGITNSMLAGSISKTKLSTDVVKATGAVLFDTTNGLSINVDDTTIEVSSNAVRIKDASVGRAKLASDVVKTSAGLAFDNTNGISFVPNPNGAGTGVATLSVGSSGVTVNGGISFTSAGTPSSSVSDGNLNVDTTNSLLYYRTGGAWKNALWAAGTANSAPSAKGVWVSNGTAPTGGQGSIGDIWISY